VSPTFRSLSNRNYRLYAGGMLVSHTGTWMQRVAQDWLVLQLSGGSGIALGFTTALQFLPMLLFGLLGGLIADRFPKRRVLAVTSTFMGGSALVLGTLVLTGLVEVWHVYVLAFALGLGNAVDTPTRQSFVVEMVGPKDLPNAVGLGSASFNAARILGPATAGLLIVAFGGTGWVFVLNALSFVAVVAVLAGLRSDELHTVPVVPRGRGQVREGLRYVRGRPDLLVVLAVVFVLGTFGLNFQLTTALMATEVFGKGAGEYGLLGSVMAVGSLAGALLAARRTRVRLRLVVGSAMAFGVVEVMVGLMPTFELFALSLVPAGALALTTMTAANTTLQLSVPGPMRGRVMALYIAVLFGGTPFGAPVIGWLAETYGARWSLLLGGAVVSGGALLAGVALLRVRGLVVRPRMRPRPHMHVLVPAQRAGVGGTLAP
jgi:MFS family permease